MKKAKIGAQGAPQTANGKCALDCVINEQNHMLIYKNDLMSSGFSNPNLGKMANNYLCHVLLELKPLNQSFAASSCLGNSKR